MCERRLKVFTDDEIWVIYNAFYECPVVSGRLYDTFGKLLDEFEEEQELREEMRRERIING